MKKIFTFLAILAIGLSSIFAGGLHFSNPYRFIGNELIDGVELNKIESIGFGIHCQSSYEYIDFDLVFPHTVKCKVNYDGITESVSVDAKDTDLNLGMKAMSCWSFPIIDTDNVLFTISPGFHHTMLFFDSGLIYSLGLGGNIQSSFNLGICYLMVGDKGVIVTLNLHDTECKQTVKTMANGAGFYLFSGKQLQYFTEEFRGMMTNTAKSWGLDGYIKK